MISWVDGGFVFLIDGGWGLRLGGVWEPVEIPPEVEAVTFWWRVASSRQDW